MALIVNTPIAVTTGAYTAITASTFARFVKILEDGTGPPAGIRVQMPVRATAAAGGGWIPDGKPFTLTPSQQPLVIGNPGGNTGPFVGIPADSNRNIAATIYCYIESVGATSAIQVQENS